MKMRYGFGEVEAVPAQWPTQSSRNLTMIPRRCAEAAYREYEAQGHGSQSFDRLHERGGFGILEAMMYLTERVERLEAKP